MRPIIGLLAEVDDEFNTRVQSPYVRAIEVAGGLPMLFPYVEDSAAVARFVDVCDGFFFTGGMDICPEHYGERASEHLGELQVNRDEFELRVLEQVMKCSKPILAICRGAQLINVALGGTLYQDIPSEVNTHIAHRQSEPKFATSHDVKILPDTPLQMLIGAERMRANSFHHQAIKALGKGLEVMALADDGIIEAVYLPGERYLRAYQWHPERLVEADKENRGLIEDFIHACAT